MHHFDLSAWWLLLTDTRHRERVLSNPRVTLNPFYNRDYYTYHPPPIKSIVIKIYINITIFRNTKGSPQNSFFSLLSATTILRMAKVWYKTPCARFAVRQTTWNNNNNIYQTFVSHCCCCCFFFFCSMEKQFLVYANFWLGQNFGWRLEEQKKKNIVCVLCVL